MPAREQLAILLSDAKWIILSCIVFSVLLFVPDQFLELYRIIYSENQLLHPQGFPYLHVPVLIIGVALWFAAGQVIAATRYRIAAPARSFEDVAAALPLLLGVLPLVACAFGLVDAVPGRLTTDEDATRLPGVIWGDLARQLDVLAVRMRWGAAVQAALAALLVACGWRLAGRMQKLADRLNKSHFGHLSGVGAALTLIAAVAAAVYGMPVTLPRAVGTFGIVALFAVCILAFAINFSLLGIRYRLPFIALPCLLAVVFGLDSINDNHTARLLDHTDREAQRHGQAADPRALQAADARKAESEFSTWLENRPDRQNYDGIDDEYPVYVVSAQGGGIYAAYQAAIFLARMQDVCPAFRHHLFAISSVSGGSVGAAVFAAALNAYDHDLIELTEDEARQRATPAAAFDPCPAITAYRTSARVPATPGLPGPLERAVQKALKQDFIAPLLAAALFPDYTQRFLPWSIPSFDRARAVEYALELAGQAMMKAAPADDMAAHNALAGSILNLWNPGSSIPALLVNATDAGSGRRFVISPFRVTPPAPRGEKPATIDYKFWNEDLPEADRARDIRLSTAAFISARFPWITPAATVANGKPGERIRLVDGGIVDNSGVETVLDLHERIAGVESTHKQPKVRLSVVVLSGGDFPERGSFAFGDLAEPLRALLNMRTSRAYVAIERSRQEFKPYGVVDDIPFMDHHLSVDAGTLKKARLDNRFYRLPLGWSLSDDTRQIIEGQSGHYWECLPDVHFEQAQSGLASSDCVEMLIYYELNKALTTPDSRLRVGAQVAISDFLVNEEDRNSKGAGDENGIIDCYQRVTRQTVNLEQAGNMRALIQQWRNAYPDRQDLLGYVMATAAFESSEFRAREQSLYYTTAEQVRTAWPRDQEIQQMSAPDIDRLYVRQPEAVARKVFGGRQGAALENRPGTDDAWLYRSRGLAFVTGRADYQRVADRERLDGFMEHPEWLLIPDINARSFIDIYFKAETVQALASLVGNKDWKGARVAVLKNAFGLADSQPLRDKELANVEATFGEIEKKAATFAACIADPDTAEITTAAR